MAEPGNYIVNIILLEKAVVKSKIVWYDELNYKYKRKR